MPNPSRSTSATKEEDKAWKWWLEKVIVPLIGGGGLIALITLLVNGLTPELSPTPPTEDTPEQVSTEPQVPTDAPSPPPNFALVFDGTNDYVDISEVGRYGSNTITYAALIRPDSDNSESDNDDWRAIILHGSAEMGVNFGLYKGRVWVGGKTESSSWEYVLLGTVSGGEWTHVAAVYSRATQMVTIYVNGQNVGSTKIAFTLDDAGFETLISKNQVTEVVPQYFAGQIDYVAIWGRALSETEIAELLRQNPDEVAYPDLLAFWPFNEGQGTDTYDEIGKFKGILGGASPSRMPLWRRLLATPVPSSMPSSSEASRALNLVNTLKDYGDTEGRRAGNKQAYTEVFSQLAEWDLGQSANDLVRQIQEFIRVAPKSDVGGEYDMVVTPEMQDALTKLRTELVVLEATTAEAMITPNPVVTPSPSVCGPLSEGASVVDATFPITIERTCPKDNKLVYVFVPTGVLTRRNTIDEDIVPSFWIKQTEVTNAEYKKCIYAGWCDRPENSWWQDAPQYPVVNVSWKDANDYNWPNGEGNATISMSVIPMQAHRVIPAEHGKCNCTLHKHCIDSVL